MAPNLPTKLVLAVFWAVTVGAGILLRPPLPVDETRYLAVAWDMWLRSDYLVPHLNGESYSHKPPLLFWLMNLGWGVFGVNDWWPRLVAPLFAGANLLLCGELARRLWPGRERTAVTAPIILFGCGFWTLFTTLTMFDMILAFFALLSILGIVSAWRDGGWAGFLLAGVGIGFGVLTKGPAILLHVLPVALSAPWWAPKLETALGLPPSGWPKWYAGVGLAVAVGLLIGLAWAVPAAMAGGEAYRDAIFWGQSAGRMVKSFAHQRAWWWYLAVLPGLLLPWLAWPAVWSALKRAGGYWPSDGGVRMCVIWFGTALLVFSLISGKQLHYLLPEFPAIALLLAVGLVSRPETDGNGSELWRQRVLPAGLIIVVGCALVALEFAPLPARSSRWLSSAEGFWGVIAVIFGLFLLVRSWGRLEAAVIRMAAAPVIVVVSLHAAMKPALDTAFDLEPFARQLKAWEDEGIALANFGKYHGQYHFLGRLEKPIQVVGIREGQVETFLREHADGYVVAYYEKPPEAPEPVATYRFRNRAAVVWTAQDLIDNPGLGDRR